MNIELQRQRAIECVSRPLLDVCHFFLYKGKRGYRYVDHPCHMNFNVGPTTQMIASIFRTDMGVGQEAGEAFWNFMTGERSPWRVLFKNSPPEAVRNEAGQILGFFLEPEAAKEEPGITYNYVIAMRMVSEHPETIDRWHMFVKDYGLDPADAFFLARMIGKAFWDSNLWSSNGINDGSHWPLTFSRWNTPGTFSFRRFREGEPKLGVKNINANTCWMDEKVRKKFSITDYAKGSTHYSKYYVGYQLEEIISGFNQYLKEVE